MNPVLLKPNSDTGAQVIIHGHADRQHGCRRLITTTSAWPWRRCWPRTSDCAAQYQVVIVEGAGCPAEINLRDRDIANMGFAEAVDCPVMLIADIDRGGVFAHLVGTLALLSPSEQARVAGFVINRFRGDMALAAAGPRLAGARTGKPVLGVLPYLHGSASGGRRRCQRERQIKAARRRLQVVVPVLPRISNHTDFDPLRLHPQVDLHFVGPGEAHSGSGSDRPAGLQSRARRSGLAARAAAGTRAISRHLRYGGKLLGICGGLQMLGEQVHDPLGIEGAPGSSAGLGLLALETHARSREATAPCQRATGAGRRHGQGYEIHCGVSSGGALDAAGCVLDDGRRGWRASADGQVFGTYLHGLFDHPRRPAALLRWAGVQQEAHVDMRALRESSIDRLADAVETHLDMAALDRLLGGLLACKV